MQNTSQLYKTIVADNQHWFETKVLINGNELTESNLFTVQRNKPGFGGDYPMVGGALSSTLTITIENLSFQIPAMAEIQVYCRAFRFNGDTREDSEWIPQGTYYIDTREFTDAGTIKITAYDAMLKASKTYPDTNHAWPYVDISVVHEIADDIGVTVDARTDALITASMMIELPTNYTEREVLQNIASAYAGNFVITDDGKLLLVPLFGNNDDNWSCNYLAADDGTSALLFGSEGWFIIV